MRGFDQCKKATDFCGLAPEVECYNDCRKGWHQYIKNSLLKLITEGKGIPERIKMATA